MSDVELSTLRSGFAPRRPDLDAPAGQSRNRRNSSRTEHPTSLPIYPPTAITESPFDDAEAAASSSQSIHSQSTVVQTPSAAADDAQLNFIAQLPPVDRGRGAWSFLIAATVCETLIWGFPYSIGVLHAYWTNTMFSKKDEATITLAATLQTGVMYMTSAFIGGVFEAYPRWVKPAQFGGLVVATISLIGAAFATKPWHLIVTVGCLYPFAGITYLPCATFLFEWFSARRGLATGVLFAGTGAGGTIFPFVLSALLNSVGYKATMISLGLGFGIAAGIALLFIKRRIPLTARTSEEGRRPTKIDLSFLKNPRMAVGISVILLTSMGNFIPTLWVPTFAEELKLRKPNGTALVALMNAASVPGAMLTGFLSDQLPLRITVLLSCSMAALACTFLWGFGKTDAPLVAFSLMWGLTGLSFVGLWSKIVSQLSGDNTNAPALIFSIFTALKGVGNFTSGPLSDALLKSDLLKGSPGAYGFNNYGLLLIYTGCVMFSGGLAGIGLRG